MLHELNLVFNEELKPCTTTKCDTIGAHTYGHNFESIGVCFEGDFNKEKMTDAQCSDEVIRFLFFLGQKYPDSKLVFRNELKVDFGLYEPDEDDI